jgi:hypothetical protein
VKIDRGGTEKESSGEEHDDEIRFSENERNSRNEGYDFGLASVGAGIRGGDVPRGPDM